jgi:hypothetical protein
MLADAPARFNVARPQPVADGPDNALDVARLCGPNPARIIVWLATQPGDTGLWLSSAVRAQKRSSANVHTFLVLGAGYPLDRRCVSHRARGAGRALADGRGESRGGARRLRQKSQNLMGYINGTLDSTVPAPLGIEQRGGPLTLGTYQDRFLKGKLDEVKIWDEALDPAAIRADMSGPKAVDPRSKAAVRWATLRRR